MGAPSKSLVAAVLAGLIGAACQPTRPTPSPPPQNGGETPAPQPPAPSPQPHVTADRIAIKSATPNDGGKVTAETVLTADVDYAIKDFEPDKYIVMTQVETTSPGATTNGGFADVEVKDASGHLTVKFPLRYVWNLPQVKFPLAVHFNLNEKLQDGASTPIASSQPIVLNAADGRVTAPPDPNRVAYEEALVEVEGVFASVQQERDLCSEKYPQLSMTIHDAYEKWIGANASVRDEVDKRERQQMVETGHDADVVKFRKARAALIRDMLSNASTDTIEARCKLYSDNLSSPRLSFNDDLSEQWTTIRRYRQSGGGRSAATGFPRPQQ